MAGKKLEGTYYRVQAKGNEQVRGARLQQSMGLLETAKTLGLDPSLLSKWELGDQRFVSQPVKESLDKLADLLKVNLTWSETKAESWLRGQRRKSKSKKRGAREPEQASDVRVVPVPAPESKSKHLAAVLDLYKDGVMTQEEVVGLLSRIKS